MEIAQIAFDTHPSNWQLRKVVLFSAECTESGITQIVAKDLNHILPQIHIIVVCAKYINIIQTTTGVFILLLTFIL